MKKETTSFAGAVVSLWACLLVGAPVLAEFKPPLTQDCWLRLRVRHRPFIWSRSPAVF